MPDRRIVPLAAVAFACLLSSAATLAAQQLPDGLPGRYVLATVEGQPVPRAVIEEGRPADAPPPPEILSSTLIIRPDGHFLMSMAYRAKRGDVERFFDNPFTGTIRKEGNGFVMQWDGAGMTPATWADTVLTYVNEGKPYAYRRQ